MNKIKIANFTLFLEKACVNASGELCFYEAEELLLTDGIEEIKINGKEYIIFKLI